MTDEEMAEKYAKGLCKTCKVDVCRYSKIKTCVTKESLKQAYLAGAEFGYNKAFVEADKNLKAIVTDFNKANKWHRVSDKLPEMDVFVYLWKEGEDFPVVARKHLPYGQKEWVWDCMWGSGFTISQLKGKDYLWKEMVLPKEIK